MMQFDWVDIPQGSLIRGTPEEDIDDVLSAHADLGLPRRYFAKEAPRAVVPVDRFAISRVPVSVQQWMAYEECNGAGLGNPQRQLSYPIDEIGWPQAVSFCQWLTGELGIPIRLPTETEWERAARGDDERTYPWGDTFDAKNANLAEHGLGHPLPVGSLPSGASPFGILDMAGNVDEWTATEYRRYPNAPPDVPEGETWAVDPHITRGGDYKHHRDLARCARRHGLYHPRVGAGFRIAFTP